MKGGLRMKKENSTIETAEEYFLHTYRRTPLVVERGEGVYLYDEEGRKYLDFAAGIAVFALGYGNERYKQALKAQIDKVIHTSNYFYNLPSVEAAKVFCKASRMEGVFFTNSGTEAIEGAIKLARKYYYKKKGVPEGEIIAMNHSFHGRSMGALSVTGQPKYQEAFAPMIGNVRFATFNDLESVKRCLTEKTCAILVEPVQGEGGLYPATKEFMKGLRKLCDEQDLLLMLDEIQCGMGRTGTMFAYEQYDILPDVITSAKALGCGIPVGVFAARGKAAKVLEPGDHGTTYGWNPLAATAVKTVFEEFERLRVLENVKEMGAYLEAKLDELQDEFSFVIERRGVGLMQGLELDMEVGEILTKARAAGVILIAAGANIIRFVPPLVIEKEHVDEMIAVLKQCFRQVQQNMNK